MSDFDFRSPLQKTSSNLDEFLKVKEESLRQKIQIKASPSNMSTLLVVVLMFSLIGLGVFSLVQFNLSGYKQNSSQVAGVSEEASGTKSNIVTGTGFSLVLNSPTPDGFKIQNKQGKFSILDNRAATVTDFTKTIDVGGGKILRSGMQVLTSEYDRKLTRAEFDQKVAQSLGADYKIISEGIVTNKGVSLSKIDSNADDNISYFTAITSENYYFIILFNETNKYSQYLADSRFTDTLLQSLYLN